MHFPLGAQIAHLPPREGGLENRALLPAALHALIAAIFARLFDRLEQIFLLWKSGDLPAPTLHRVPPATPRQRPSARIPRHRGPRSKSIRRRARSAQESRARKATPQPASTPTMINQCPSAPPNRTHDPPPIAGHSRLPKHVDNITIS